MDKQDLYQGVTNAIIERLEQGVGVCPPRWNGASWRPPLRANGERYKGINVVLLWIASQERGYAQRRWMTFKQAQELGACVRKGERGTRVVYANRIERTEEGNGGEDVRRSIPFLKAYATFNVEQIDGLGTEWFDPPPVLGGAAPVADAEAFLSATGAQVRHGGDKAFYAPSQDLIVMPPIEAFVDAEGYYATRAHETVHWTGHETRLARDGGKRFGDHAYAFEELVAELGAAFLCADLGLSAEPRADHAEYLASWLDILKSDKRAIFTAASAAQAACDHLQRAALAQSIAA